MNDDNPLNKTLLQMTIEQGRQIERILQITENMEERQDDLKTGLDYVLKSINGNGDGRGGLKTVAVVHEGELGQLRKDIESVKKYQEDYTETLQLAKTFFTDKKQLAFGWKQFLMGSMIQVVLLVLLSVLLQKVGLPVQNIGGLGH